MKGLIIHQWEDEKNFFHLVQKVLENDTQKTFDMLIITKNDCDIKFLRERLVFDYSEYTINLKNAKINQFSNLTEKKQSIENLIDKFNDRVEKVYIQIGAGDPIIQHFLSHYCLERYAGKCFFLTENGGVVPDSIEEQPPQENIFTRNVYEHVHELVLSGNYKSAKKIVVFNKCRDQRIIDLLDFGENLKNLYLPNPGGLPDPFQLLIDVLNEINEQYDSEEIHYVELLKNLRKKDQRAFIYYLHNYADFLYDENDLIDFIVLFYRLAEETLLYSIGWDINWNIREEQRQFIVRKDARFSLRIPRTERLSKHYHRYMTILKNEIRTIEERKKVKIRRDKCVGLDRLSERDRYFAELYLFFNNKMFEEFLDLRHEGVSGHGFADFTREDFEQMLGGNSPLSFLESYLARTNLLPNDSIFKLVQKGIMGLLTLELEQAKKVSTIEVAH